MGMHPILVTFVRHGETAENASGIIQGWTPTDLNDTGFRQARACATWMKQHFSYVASELRLWLHAVIPSNWNAVIALPFPTSGLQDPDPDPKYIFFPVLKALQRFLGSFSRGLPHNCSSGGVAVLELCQGAN